jgi:hypothetical protein
MCYRGTNRETGHRCICHEMRVLPVGVSVEQLEMLVKKANKVDDLEAERVRLRKALKKVVAIGKEQGIAKVFAMKSAALFALKDTNDME